MSFTRTEQTSDISAPEGDSPLKPFALNLLHPSERDRIVITYTNLGLTSDEIREAVAPLSSLYDGVSTHHKEYPMSPLPGFAEKLLKDAYMTKTGKKIPDSLEERMQAANDKARQERLARAGNKTEVQKTGRVLFRFRPRKR